jgi:hypothetical protein
MGKDSKFQQILVNKLRYGVNSEYAEASIYTIQLDLIQGNGISEVLLMLFDASKDSGKKDEFIDEVKKLLESI